MKGKSWNLSLRPKKGINQGGILAEKVEAYCKKQIGYRYVYEKQGTDAAHFHAQIWTEERMRDVIVKSLRRIMINHCEGWDKVQDRVMFGYRMPDGSFNPAGVKKAFSTWEGYLEKENEVFGKPPDNEESFYPSEEEQETAQKKKSSNLKEFERYDKLWEECEYGDTSRDNVCTFFDERFFKYKDIPILRDKRKCVDLVDFYLAWREGSGLKIFYTKDQWETRRQLQEAKDFLKLNKTTDNSF